jgi:hypothetical protein
LAAGITPPWQPALVQWVVKIGCTAAANDTLALPHVHAPPLQVCPRAQAFPHDPQLLASVCVSTHAPLQSSLPPAHAQAPPAHDVPLGQTLPHPPQLLGSVVVSMQVPLHAAVPVGQTH